MSEPASVTSPIQPATTPRLARDPYTRLGGVASGLSHHFGIDVSIIRILFVITGLASGVGVVLYLLSWLVIPRATVWPPASQPRSMASLSGRELGFGLAIVALLFAIGLSSTDQTGAVVIPLALLIGGIWLLVQPPLDAADGSDQSATNPLRTSVVAQPVPPRSKKRSVAIVSGFVALLVLLVSLPVMLVGAYAFGSTQDPVALIPQRVADLPAQYASDTEHLKIDLTNLDASDFAGQTGPVVFDGNIGLGTITIVVPDGLAVAVIATVGLGELDVLGETFEGVTETITVDNLDADITLDLNVDIGRIEVVQG